MFNRLNARTDTGRRPTARAPRQRNEKLLAAIKACGWSYDACVASVRAAARDNDDELASCKPCYDSRARPTEGHGDRPAGTLVPIPTKRAVGA